jgi:PKD repeat protein
VFDGSGTFLTKWGSFGSGEGEFNEPWGVTVDSAGNAYVSDGRNHRIQVFAPFVPPPTSPVASFTGAPTSGSAPLAVQFTDTSTEDPAAWLWDFGDNTSSSLRNPEKIYGAPGVYTVSLTATNTGGSGTAVKTDYITVTVPPPAAHFTVNVTSGTTPLAVQFTDQSTGTATSWFWTFGDGSTSTDQHPFHTYRAQGTYTVNLTASNSGGADTLTRQDYINVTNMKGDFNGDSVVDIGDVAKVAYMVVGKTPADPAADFNENGVVDIGDASKIAYFFVGNITAL